MGGTISKMRYLLRAVKTSLDTYEELSSRIAISPGLPKVASSTNKPTPPYWTIPASPIAREGANTALPLEYIDVVIIGSGITGTAVAKFLLEYERELAADLAEPGEKRKDIRVVMLEARDTCSGATGRNGGHIGPIVYNEFRELKSAHGISEANDVLRFRLAHVTSLISTAREEGLLSASQAREVESFDVYGNPTRFANAKEQLHEFLEEGAKDITKGFRLLAERYEVEKLQLASSIVGCISRPGGAIHPYRFVTGVLSNLLQRHSNFQIFTHTPCTTITSTPAGYVVQTPRGKIRAAHVIHATNAWSSHLLPGMRGKIVPLRASMTAQRPGQGLSKSWAGNRAFVFYPVEDTSSFEYLTQLLPSPKISDDEMAPDHPLPSAGELMFGGRVQPASSNNIGISDDRGIVFENEAHLGGVLERFFAGHWGAEATDDELQASVDGNKVPGKTGKGRMRSSWSGIIGMSADLLPWVGRVPHTASGRKEPIPSTQSGLAPPGEWISAGYTGEGMVHAWLSGRALVRMLLGLPAEGSQSPEDPKLPQTFLITPQRIKESHYEAAIDQW